jgi:CheY-like chemotaxis protein
MTVSAGQRGDAARCRELGIRAYLSRPIEPLDLLDSILQVLNETGDAGLITRHSLRERRRQLNVLLVGADSPQRAHALSLLEKLGHSGMPVDDGATAVEMCAGANFDAVLVDLEPAGTAAIEASTRIRQADAANGRRTMIVALSADPAAGDREASIEAGFDHYLGKPIQPAALAATLAQLSADAGARPSVPASAAGEARRRDAGPAYDRARVLSSLGDDAELLQQLVEMYLADEQRMRSDVRNAARQGDHMALRHALSTLKGAITSFYADAALRSLAAAEQICRGGDLTRLPAALDAADRELNRLADALRTPVSV